MSETRNGQAPVDDLSAFAAQLAAARTEELDTLAQVRDARDLAKLARHEAEARRRDTSALLDEFGDGPPLNGDRADWLREVQAARKQEQAAEAEELEARRVWLACRRACRQAHARIAGLIDSSDLPLFPMNGAHGAGNGTPTPGTGRGRRRAKGRAYP